MERAAGFTHADTGSVNFDKLDAVLALSSTSKQDAALFAEMLSLPHDGRYPALELMPQERREQNAREHCAQIETFARESPALLIFDDAHWADPTSLEVFGRAVDRIATLRVLLLSYRAMALWMLGYPDAALTDAAQALSVAREIGHAAVLMFALGNTPRTYVQCGKYAAASALANELISLADEKDASLWKAAGMIVQGGLFVLTGKAADAVETITSGITAWRSTGATAGIPRVLAILARAYGELGQLDDAWRCIDEAMTTVETTQERWCEARG